MNLRSRLVALTGWLLVALFAVAVSRCVRLHSADPPRKPLGEADLHELYADQPPIEYLKVRLSDGWTSFLEPEPWSPSDYQP